MARQLPSGYLMLVVLTPAQGAAFYGLFPAIRSISGISIVVAGPASTLVLLM